MAFQPDYRHVEDAAYNRVPKRLPLYEHLVNVPVIEKILDKPIGALYATDKKAYFREYCRFFREMGYDTVSYECCITGILPGGGALGRHVKGAIQTREDFERYPWDSLRDRFFETFAADYDALREALPEGMRAVGGVGNGVFEITQDLTGYIDLCYMREDDPDLFSDLFKRVSGVMAGIWERFLSEWADVYCVCRFGDDLGFKSTTLLSADDVREHIVPGYRQVIEKVHAAGKPFLLHSCGNIFNVMEDLIGAGIDAKHSNEDQIAPFPVWVERYGDRIGNFGGIDTDAVCRLPEDQMRAYIEDVVDKCQGHGGFAFGSGNSIPDYVPVSQYLTMLRIVRAIRGETL